MIRDLQKELTNFSTEERGEEGDVNRREEGEGRMGGGGGEERGERRGEKGREGRTMMDRRDVR